MGYFAVIDTETNWENEVMSVGIVTADTQTFRPGDSGYWILTPECYGGGMYDSVLDIVPGGRKGTREAAMAEINAWLGDWGVERMFAYNARFDKGHLPELQGFDWFDIMRIAAYRQHNPAIPACAPCCSTGRMKRNYGVEPMLQLLSGDCGYRETHNALCDAADELKIMALLGLPLTCYECARI